MDREFLNEMKSARNTLINEHKRIDQLIASMETVIAYYEDGRGTLEPAEGEPTDKNLEDLEKEFNELASPGKKTLEKAIKEVLAERNSGLFWSAKQITMALINKDYKFVRAKSWKSKLSSVKTTLNISCRSGANVFERKASGKKTNWGKVPYLYRLARKDDAVVIIGDETKQKHETLKDAVVRILQKRPDKLHTAQNVVRQLIREKFQFTSAKSRESKLNSVRATLVTLHQEQSWLVKREKAGKEYLYRCGEEQ